MGLMESGLVDMTGMSEAASRGRVLLQEREPSLRRVLQLSLGKAGFDITPVEDVPGARKHLESEYDAIILEYYPQTACGPFIEQVREASEPTQSPAVLVTTTFRPGDEWRRTYKPDILLYKPFDIRYLEKKLLEVLHERTENEKAIR